MHNLNLSGYKFEDFFILFVNFSFLFFLCILLLTHSFILSIVLLKVVISLSLLIFINDISK